MGVTDTNVEVSIRSMNDQYVTRLHKSTLSRIELLAEREAYALGKAVRLALDLGLYSLAEAVTVHELLRRLGPPCHGCELGKPAKLPKDLAREACTAAKAAALLEREVIEALIEAGCRIIERYGGLKKTDAIVNRPRRIAHDWSDFVRLPEPAPKEEGAELEAA